MSARIAGPGFTDALPVLDSIRATVDRNKPETLWNALNLYLNYCSQSGFFISNRSLYHACGIDRKTAYTWACGTRRQYNPEYRKFALECKTICAAAREQYGVEGLVNPILTIWMQKYYDGFTDTPAQESNTDPLGEIPDPQTIIKKYGESICET